jgi:subtilisin family serine protease
MLGDARRPLFVVPAGNDSKRQIAPDFEVSSVGFGRSRQTVTVTAVGPGLTALDLASFSNTGANFAAPGVAICSADEGGGLRVQNGTSLAAAHVAGIAALWLEASGGETPGGVAPWLERVLQENASFHALNPDLGIHDVGHGLVQAPA